ncbi:MAG: NAD(+) synthase, partial [Chitinivibrionales bacterium]|nr:NAD(+) synthase [Chitinivibrionales bacterium]
MTEQSSRAVIPAIDCEHETQRIVEAVRRHVGQSFRKRGVVLGLSGGIDSSVTAALCVRALGPERVFGLLTPERESSDDSSTLAFLLAAQLGIQTCHEDISPILEAAGCYRRRDEAVASVVPSFGPGYTCKLSLPPFGGSRYRLYSIVVRAPSGETTTKRLPHQAYLAVVAATNFKQRARKMMEYYHADRLNYA